MSTTEITIISVQTAERTATAKVGDVVLHFNPSTGRQVRQVEVVEIISEDVAQVEIVTGPNRGNRYPLATNKMAA